MIKCIGIIPHNKSKQKQKRQMFEFVNSFSLSPFFSASVGKEEYRMLLSNRNVISVNLLRLERVFFVLLLLSATFAYKYSPTRAQIHFIVCRCMRMGKYTHTRDKTPQSGSLFTNIGSARHLFQRHAAFILSFWPLHTMLLTMMTAFIATAPNESSTHTMTPVHYGEIITYPYTKNLPLFQYIHTNRWKLSTLWRRTVVNFLQSSTNP